jgi:hypothetical protein
MFENSLNYFGRKSRNNSAASKQSIEEKSPANRLSNTWNTDAVWTTESDDELSKDLKKAPSITVNILANRSCQLRACLDFSSKSTEIRQ